MDINLPLVLVVLSILGIIICLYDFIFLRTKRTQKIKALKDQHPDWNKRGSSAAKVYEQALINAKVEHWVIKETKSFLPIILIVLVVRSFIIEPFQIPSSSMEPTLDVGDFILVNKYTYGIRLPVLGTQIIENNKPQRGDVMVFFPPNDERYFIKRVVGIPGDLIEYNKKVLTINGEQQDLEPIVDPVLDPLQRDLFMESLGERPHLVYHQSNRMGMTYKVTVKPGHYFMMGDNRDNSSDSRFWGQVPEDRIVGKAFAIWMHWKDWTSLPSFSRVGNIQ